MVSGWPGPSQSDEHEAPTASRGVLGPKFRQNAVCPCDNLRAPDTSTPLSAAAQGELGLHGYNHLPLLSDVWPSQDRRAEALFELAGQREFGPEPWAAWTHLSRYPVFAIWTMDEKLSAGGSLAGSNCPVDCRPTLSFGTMRFHTISVKPAFHRTDDHRNAMRGCVLAAAYGLAGYE